MWRTCPNSLSTGGFESRAISSTIVKNARLAYRSHFQAVRVSPRLAMKCVTFEPARRLTDSPFGRTIEVTPSYWFVADRPRTGLSGRNPQQERRLRQQQQMTMHVVVARDRRFPLQAASTEHRLPHGPALCCTPGALIDQGDCNARSVHVHREGSDLRGGRNA